MGPIYPFRVPSSSTRIKQKERVLPWHWYNVMGEAHLLHGFVVVDVVLVEVFFFVRSSLHDYSGELRNACEFTGSVNIGYIGEHFSYFDAT